MSRRAAPCLLAVFLAAGVFNVASATPPGQVLPARVTLRGQVVCSNCWSEADRKTTAYGTPADLKCARLCAKDAVPAALAVDEKRTCACIFWRTEHSSAKARVGSATSRSASRSRGLCGRKRERCG